MTNELVTTAFDTTYLFAWGWVLIPVLIGVILFVWALALFLGRAKEGAMLSLMLGIYVIVIGVSAMGVLNSLFMSDLDKDLLRSDVSEQLQIEELDIDSNASGWITGRGPEDEFVKFKLVEKDGVEDTYIVLVEER